MRAIRYGGLLFVALLALSVLFAGGCAPPGTHRKVRRMIRSGIEQELGPADRYDVYTSRDSLSRLMDGRLSEVKVHGVNVRPAPGYVLDDLYVEARNVRVNRHQKTVEGADSADITARIGEKSLAAMIAQDGSLQSPTVRITKDNVTVGGRYEVAGAMPLNVTATGTFRVTGPTTVEFASDRVTAAGMAVPIPVNRTIDFSAIYDPLIVQSVHTEPGWLVLTGTVDWTKFGNNASRTR